MRRVTRRHGATFARELLEGELPYEAFDATAIIAWPVGYLVEHGAQDRYHDLSNEIVTRTLAAAQDAIAAAFVEIARDVIERERQKRRERRP
ncbi:MAG TPA: hypothetical protein VFP80_16280 [Thermoanaerobaculia bacterium]|nr:hypothetical protein [Thermoanaerobaculia bacterium]